MTAKKKSTPQIGGLLGTAARETSKKAPAKEAPAKKAAPKRRGQTKDAAEPSAYLQTEVPRSQLRELDLLRIELGVPRTAIVRELVRLLAEDAPTRNKVIRALS